MLKKLAMTALFLSTATSAAWGQGFYIGAGVGPEGTSFHQRAHVSRPNSFNVIDKTRLAGTGIFGTLFAGYERYFRRFYIAGEVNANASSDEFSSSNKEFIHQNFSSTHYKMRRSAGISILPGYLLKESTVVYARLGLSEGNFRIKTSDASLRNVDHNLSGFRFGLGIKEMLTQHFSIRMEFSHINYDHKRFTVVDSRVTKTTRIKPEVGQVEFGLMYDFC